MKAKIRETRTVAQETLMVVFALEGPRPDFRPGQYFFVTLPDRGYHDEKGLRHHFSVVTSPTEPEVLGLATRLRDSAFKKTLRELPVGTEVEVEEPKGSFVLPEETTRPLVFIAGGIGITVFHSMLRYIADTKLPYRVTLVYSNRDQAGTPFLDELKGFEQQIPGFHLILTMTQDPAWSGEKRKIDAEFLREHLGDLDGFTFLIAGPPAMATAVTESLQTAGVTEGHLFTDNFTGY